MRTSWPSSTLSLRAIVLLWACQSIKDGAARAIPTRLIRSKAKKIENLRKKSQPLGQ